MRRHWHHHHRGLRGYVGHRMHRRLFVWFGLAIAATALTVVGTMHLFGDGSRAWQTERRQLETWVGGRYARVWSDPVARHELSLSIARDLQLGVRVRDAHGATIDGTGATESCRHWLEVTVHSPAGAVLGTSEFCPDQHRAVRRPWLVVVMFFAVGSVLWGIAGKVSRRISRPLTELADVAREIGEGNLGSRVRLCHQYHGEVGELSEAINDMATRIERQLRDQRELLATVSHEMRTPLQRIRLLLELAEASGADPKVMADIDAEVVEIDALVGDLLASARVEFAALSPRSLDAGDVANRAIERAGLPGARAEIDPDVGALMADATLLSRALSALLDNARKYGGDTIVMRVHRVGDSVAFDVEDNGSGFAPGDEERVLEPFYRGARATNDERPGVGLGLALVRRIAEAHGGRAYARNRPEGGARVGIELPRQPRARRPA